VHVDEDFAEAAIRVLAHGHGDLVASDAAFDRGASATWV
jgi:hypothetical protein